MIWPQQYHKEKQGEELWPWQWSEAGRRFWRHAGHHEGTHANGYEDWMEPEEALKLLNAADVPSQPVEAPGEQPLYVQSAEIDLGPESPLLLEVPAPQPEAPAEQLVDLDVFWKSLHIHYKARVYEDHRDHEGAFAHRVPAPQPETSLAEAQKERDDANDDYKCLREEIARLAAYWDLDASRTEVVEEIIRRTRTLDERYGEQIDRAQAAEQQLVEVKAELDAALSEAASRKLLDEIMGETTQVELMRQLAEAKAQLDAQAGVIRELAEALEKIAHGAPHPDRYYLMEVAAAALAHVREPETK